MHTLALQFAPVLGAEKSKVPFYIAGGLLVAWALIVSLVLGMRRPDFPGDGSGERVVIGITVVLVLAAVSMAVATSGGEESSAATAPATPVATTSAEAPAAATAPPTATSGSPGTPAAPPAPINSSAAPTLLALQAAPSGELKYNTKQLAAKAGQVTIVMANMSPEEHNVTVAQGSKILGATPTFVGGTKRLTLTLKPGTYTFYCSVPGHRQGGMEGTLSIS
jgi:plastocyanin